MRSVLLLALACALFAVLTAAAPMPSPVQRRTPQPDLAAAAPAATPEPYRRRHVALPRDATADDVYEFYKPVAREAAAAAAADVDAPTPVKRSDVPSVPLSQLGPPSFPAQYPSCYNCQQKYSSLSSCMQAASVFQNATNIFNSPLSYIAVIKCACTDTFQAVYPQCVQCFQMTDQCYYLGTDPKGTGAPAIVTNLRQICAFGSSLLGGAEKANYPDYNNTFTPTSVPAYTDVPSSAVGAGYNDQSTGPIFGSSSASHHRPSVQAVLPLLGVTTLVCLASLLLV